MAAEPEDEALLARLNALRPSGVSLTSTNGLVPRSTRPLPAEVAGEDALAARFAKLGGTARASVVDVGAPYCAGVAEAEAEDGRDLDELLQELDAVSREHADLSAAELSRADSLLAKARVALAGCNAEATGKRKVSPEIGDHVAAVDGKALQEDTCEGETRMEEPALSEEQEADEYVSRVLAGLSHGAGGGAEHSGVAADEVQSDRAASGEQADDGEDDDGSSADGFALPSVPTLAPAGPARTAADEEDESPSLSVLPSAPASAPVRRKRDDGSWSTLRGGSRPEVGGVAGDDGGHDDERGKAWCCICLGDAAVRCLGCADESGDDDGEGDDSLYYERCWHEGHQGEDAGFAERSHRAVRLVAKGKGTKAKRRVAAH